MDLTIIGIDCATEPKKTGMALGRVKANTLVLSEVTTGARDDPASIVYEWIRPGGQVLIALDAPLGWPNELGTTLVGHTAGCSLEPPPNDLFRRETDRFVARTLGRQPLDVGADRIARTAYAALSLLDKVRNLTDSGIPLAWSPKLTQEIEALEVYPAGTLTALGLPNSGYKRVVDRHIRERILVGIRGLLDTTNISEDALLGNADLLDAAICVLAAKDFCDWKVMAPRDMNLAKNEGWIWVRPRMGQIKNGLN